MNHIEKQKKEGKLTLTALWGGGDTILFACYAVWFLARGICMNMNCNTTTCRLVLNETKLGSLLAQLQGQGRGA